MNKEEFIKEAWGEDKIGYSRETGWAATYCVNGIDDFTSEMQERFDFEFPEQDIVRFRPKSLEGVEDNNGWIKIEDEKDLPKEDFLFKYHVCNNNTVFTTPLSFKYVERRWLKGQITHFQPVRKPKPPVY